MEQKIEVSDIKINNQDPLQDIISLLKTSSTIQDTIENKLCIKFDSDVHTIILDVFSYLLQDKSCPLKSIIENISQIFADGKIDSYDIPIVVKTITDVFNTDFKSLKSLRVEISHIGLVMKILIMILLDVKVIKLDNNLAEKQNREIIFKTIDSSMILLQTTLNLTKTTFKCCC